MSSPSPNVAAAISNAASAYGVDAGAMTAIAGVESNFNPNAKAPTSTATGLFQITNGTWNALTSRYGQQHGITRNTSRYNANANAMMAAALTAENANALSRAGITPNAANLYGAHFMGAPIAVKALSAPPNTPVSRVLTAEQIDANRSILSGKTIGQVQSYFANRLGSFQNAALKANPNYSVNAVAVGQRGAPITNPNAHNPVPASQPQQSIDGQYVAPPQAYDQLGNPVAIPTPRATTAPIPTRAPRGVSLPQAYGQLANTMTRPIDGPLSLSGMSFVSPPARPSTAPPASARQSTTSLQTNNSGVYAPGGTVAARNASRATQTANQSMAGQGIASLSGRQASGGYAKAPSSVGLGMGTTAGVVTSPHGNFSPSGQYSAPSRNTSAVSAPSAASLASAYGARGTPAAVAKGAPAPSAPQSAPSARSAESASMAALASQTAASALAAAYGQRGTPAAIASGKPGQSISRTSLAPSIASTARVTAPATQTAPRSVNARTLANPVTEAARQRADIAVTRQNQGQQIAPVQSQQSQNAQVLSNPFSNAVAKVAAIPGSIASRIGGALGGITGQPGGFGAYSVGSYSWSRAPSSGGFVGINRATGSTAYANPQTGMMSIFSPPGPRTGIVSKPFAPGSIVPGRAGAPAGGGPGVSGVASRGGGAPAGGYGSNNYGGFEGPPSNAGMDGPGAIGGGAGGAGGKG